MAWHSMRHIIDALTQLSGFFQEQPDPKGGTLPLTQAVTDVPEFSFKFTCTGLHSLLWVAGRAGSSPNEVFITLVGEPRSCGRHSVCLSLNIHCKYTLLGTEILHIEQTVPNLRGSCGINPGHRGKQTTERRADPTAIRQHGTLLPECRTLCTGQRASVCGSAPPWQERCLWEPSADGAKE